MRHRLRLTAPTPLGGAWLQEALPRHQQQPHHHHRELRGLMAAMSCPHRSPQQDLSRGGHSRIEPPEHKGGKSFTPKPPTETTAPLPGPTAANT